MSRKHRKQHERRSAATSGERSPGTALWLHGLHPVAAALGNPARVCLRLLATEESAAEAERLARPRPLGVERVDRRELDRIAGPGAVHQGLALQVEALPEPTIEDVLGTTDLVVVLDQVVDPHNVGAVLRSAAAFGAGAVIVQDRHSPQATGTLAKAASGALEWVPLVRVGNLARGLDQLKSSGFWLVGLDGEARQAMGTAPLPSPLALVLGAEGSGLRRLSREGCDLLLRIPSVRPGLSLNVSNACAAALWEARRGTAI